MTDDADDGPDDGPDDAPGAAGPEGEPRKRRRRRRRRPAGADASPVGSEPAVPAEAGPTSPSPAPPPTLTPDGGRARREWASRAPRPAADPAAGDATGANAPADAVDAPRERTGNEPAATDGASTEGRRARRRRGERGDRGPEPSGRNQGPTASGPTPGPASGPTPQARADGGRGRGDGGRSGGGRDGGRTGGGRDGRRDGRGGGRGEASRDPRYDARLDAKADATDDWAPSEDAPSAASAAPAEPKMARLEQKVRGAGAGGRTNETPNPDDEAPEPAEAGIAWGTDDPGPAPEVTLAADLPPNVEGDDDPATADLAEAGTLPVADEVANFAGVRFQPGGRVQWFDASEADYAVGDRVVVDAERGTKLGWIAIAPTRRSTRGFDQSRGPRRIVRRAHEGDLKHEREGDDQKARALRLAKDAAAALRLPLKVFRVEVLSGKVNVYYTCDEMRMDMRAFVQNLTRELGGNPRIELRQLGVRDEAKAVGGIGTCGLTLCCTTWLPDFVPVSIKMAKDQGLVLSPTKVSGQCGRLKCCLVYEQANYAEMRKGLPKLGKRVVSARGEGRVVEVDVLHQRLRVSYGHGDSEVLPATDVKPLFPPGTQPPRPERGERGERDERPGRAPRGDRSDRGPRPPRPEPGGDVSPEAAIAAQAAEDADDSEPDDDVPPDPSRDPSQYDEPDDDFPDPSRDPNAPDDDDL